MNLTGAKQEKIAAALSSVGAALFLTILKVIVGILSGSIGILAEAAHSGLDLIAAAVTYLAVRIAGEPADANHPFGHGKVESLSALVETLLLLLTCAWIIREAIARLIRGGGHVEASFWAFAVMAISIVVDAGRSAMLKRAAIKHRSQALEADALHFSTDIWSSAVVIFGLICVRVAAVVPALGFLVKADALAALVVAAIVVIVSIKLGRRTVEALMDAAPAGAAEKVKSAVESVTGVRDCHAVRIRHSGPDFFVDLHVLIDGSQSLAQAHALTETIETRVRGILPGADVTVHPEPWAPSESEVNKAGNAGH